MPYGRNSDYENSMIAEVEKNPNNIKIHAFPSYEYLTDTGHNHLMPSAEELEHMISKDYNIAKIMNKISYIVNFIAILKSKVA